MKRFFVKDWPLMAVPSKRLSCYGFTLIETLVALLIISIVLTTLLQSTYSFNKNSQIVYYKTIAHYLAMNTLHEIQLGLREIPDGIQHFQLHQLNENWEFITEKTAMPNLFIDKIKITIDYHQKIKTELVSFIPLAQPLSGNSH